MFVKLVPEIIHENSFKFLFELLFCAKVFISLNTGNKGILKNVKHSLFEGFWFMPNVL